MNTPLPLAADSKNLFSAYASGEHDRLSGDFLSVLKYFSQTLFLNKQALQDAATPFLKIFFTLFTQPDYIISEQYVPAFILHNTLISNLTAVTPFKNTDVILNIVRNQPSNFVKILALYSSRNSVSFDRKLFFDASPKLATLWYNQYCELYKSGLVNADIVRNMAEHMRFHDERMMPELGMAAPYFGSSYVGDDIDRDMKPLQNKMIQRYARFEAKNTPDPKKIAVISDFWYPAHSVYRNYAAFVKELQKNYSLSLFHILTPREKLDVSMFDHVQQFSMSGGIPRDILSAANFQLVYFPDIGMTEPSMLLSNCRIAPIQISSPGHSVSSWGADIDYFISGADVEVAREPEKNYSERLVLLPGMGAIHNQPRYVPQGITKKTSQIIVNCPWSGHKTHARYLETLRTLFSHLEEKPLLRIFPGIGVAQENAHFPFADELQKALGEVAIAEVRAAMEYDDYMRLMEEGDLTIDSFHFAGCNGIADSLFLRKPTVVWEGDKWYNRIGPSMLRLVGLDEFICENEKQYIDKCLLLIRNAKKRAQVKVCLEKANLDNTIFSTKDAPSFARAVDYLIANHEKLQQEKSRKPIKIR